MKKMGQFNRAVNRVYNFVIMIYCDILKGTARCFAVFSKRISVTFPHILVPLGLIFM